MSDSLEQIAAELLEATGASRVTIRLDTPGEVYPVAAEAVAPGVRSIRGATEIDLRKAETFRFLDRERRTLVQSDCLRDEPAVPPELIELYGVRAQVLVPVVSAGGLAGIVSVHHAATVRDWTEAEVAAAEAAAARVRDLL
jgi:GAF domain-containing protein